MGYTNYYETKKTVGTAKQWAAFIEDVNKIFKATDIPLANGRGDAGTLPTVSKSVVSFNGVEDDSHETLYIERVSTARMDKGDKLVFNFCKTAEKPYDKVVVAVLVALKQHFPASKISSDGGMDDWQAGIDLAKGAVGYGSNFELEN